MPRSASGMGVYPRVYGGTCTAESWTARPPGLSPRVRGNRRRVESGAGRVRSIPACTGEPRRGIRRPSRRKVYPRVYGGTQGDGYTPINESGLSPRVRGNRWRDLRALMPSGSIPACTGEPAHGSPPRNPSGVYPRVYGGTTGRSGNYTITGGLSPRVRGNRLAQPGQPGCPGSIPACTGEPPRPRPASCVSWVYPRVYGGTVAGNPDMSLVGGLSPRVRGNPSHVALNSSLNEVYPRVYGGTSLAKTEIDPHAGLSPRVRGNLPHVFRNGDSYRSIPACTGEPCIRRPRTECRAVYPRVYGGTCGSLATCSFSGGLSPRVRGNLEEVLLEDAGARSIPACTGEPCCSNQTATGRSVYPRVYGGTGMPRHFGGGHAGLSPRVRGNPGRVTVRVHSLGSIPACTGEPSPGLDWTR